MSTYRVEPAVLRPLFRAFWTSAGWRDPPVLPSGEELEAGVAAGVMFADPVRRDHDEWVAAARRAAADLDAQEVSDAFVAGLATRRMDLRSALGSYAVARNLPEHAFEAAPGSARCRTCGLHREVGPTELNVLSFERFKWGGTRHDDLHYAAFDLEQLRRAPRVDVDAEAVALGRSVLDALRSVPAAETATQAVKRLRVLKGNDSERVVVIDVLGLCGVLAVAGRPSHRSQFVPYAERRLPPHHFVDRTYPVCWWRGRDGVSDDAVQSVLPTLQQSTGRTGASVHVLTNAPAPASADRPERRDDDDVT